MVLLGLGFNGRTGAGGGEVFEVWVLAHDHNDSNVATSFKELLDTEGLMS
jgi:hypothetical protein